MNAPTATLPTSPRLTSLSHGGGCGCKIAPGVLEQILAKTAKSMVPPQLLVGIETAGSLSLTQNTTGKKLCIAIEGELAKVIARILAKPRDKVNKALLKSKHPANTG